MSITTIPKDALEAQLGKYGFLAQPPILINKVGYVQGIPLLDETKIGNLYFKLRPKGIELYASVGFKTVSAGIPFTDIKAIELTAPADIVSLKERSVLGRGLVGGLLLGPVGAIVGGMSGLKDSTRVESADALLTMLVEQAGAEHFVVLSVKGKHRAEVESYLKKHLPAYVS